MLQNKNYNESMKATKGVFHSFFSSFRCSLVNTMLTKIGFFSFLMALLVACTATPAPTPTPFATPSISEPKIGSPDPKRPNEEIGISVDVAATTGLILKYEWLNDGQGEIVRGQNTPAVTYRTPKEAGTYNVRVKVSWDGGSVEKTTTVKVETASPVVSAPQVEPTATIAPQSVATNTPVAVVVVPTALPTNTPSPLPTFTAMPLPTDTPQPTYTPVPSEPTAVPAPPTETAIPPQSTTNVANQVGPFLQWRQNLGAETVMLNIVSIGHGCLGPVTVIVDGRTLEAVAVTDRNDPLFREEWYSDYYGVGGTSCNYLISGGQEIISPEKSLSVPITTKGLGFSKWCVSPSGKEWLPCP